MNDRARVLQRSAITRTWQPLTSDGELSTVDPGTVTVHVTRSDGTDVKAAGTATTTVGVTRTYALTAVDTADLDIFTETWTVTGQTVAVTSFEIVGGYLFSIAQLRTVETSLSDAGEDPSATLLNIRTEVEESFESWTNLSMVPRFAVVDVKQSGCRLFSDKMYLRSVRWVRSYTTPTAYTDLDADALDLVTFNDSGSLWRSAGWGCRTIAGVEYGWDRPPADGQRMALLYARICAMRAEGTGHNVSSFSTPDGQTVTYEPKADPTHYKIINEFLRRQDIDHRIPGLA